jgi:hypothetical protein
MNKKRIRMLEAQVSQILWEVWDPIGVYDDSADSAAQSEYEDYVLGVVGQLTHKSSEASLTEYLHRLAIEEMGIRRYKKAQTAAKHLLQLMNETASESSDVQR